MRRDEILQLLSTIFDEPVENLSESTGRAEIFGWDSLGMLTLMAELDERLNIQLNEKDIQLLHTVGDLLDLLRKTGKLD